MNFTLLFSCLASLAIAQTPGDYELGPGDVIDVQVHGHELGRTQFVVGASGEISFPYVGKVELDDLTVFEAEDALKTALADGYIIDPTVTVQVAKHRSQRVEVLGAVGKAGLYYLEGPTTVRAMVATAGGIEGAKGGLILVTRGAQTFRIGLADLEGSLGDLQLEPGDVVTVDPAGSVVYLAGEVSKPGAIAFTDGLTVSQALIRVGGNSQLSRLSGTYILRGDEKISVNLKRVLKGKDADLALQPGDRVFVPESAL